MHLIGLAVVVIIVAALYRRIESIRVLTTVLWVIMLVTMATVIGVPVVMTGKTTNMADLR
ncbi:MAG: hypothetical protein ACLPUO_04880 [Streptosporangiaceae bacterium]